MERILNVKDMMERYGCSRQTAIRYMLKMEHMEHPYGVRESVVREWDNERTVKPPSVILKEKMKERLNRKGA